MIAPAAIEMKDNVDNATKQLLLIDDDPNLILLVQDYLEFQGYEVITADNGQDALEILQDHVPDLIICDIMMPDIDGYEVVERIRQDNRISWIPVIFLSAKGQTSDRVKGLNTGADVYLVKPFEPEELVAQVESSLNQANRFMKQAGGVTPTYEETEKIQVPAGVTLTRTETKVVQLVAQGLANREIADNLNVSQRTVESHVSNMLNKTRLHNRTELARWAIQSHLAH